MTVALAPLAAASAFALFSALTAFMKALRPFLLGGMLLDLRNTHEHNR